MEQDEGTITPLTASSDIQCDKMVAPSTSNSARRAMLEERKRDIEAMLAKYHLELKKLCIQEAELTGVIPQEMPVEIGEIPPIIRRKVGTAYQLNEKLLNMSIKESSRDQLIADLELKIQVHINMMNAALGLSMEGNISKTLKRQHTKEYMTYKEHVRQLEEQLRQLRESAPSEVKQKKKPRVPEPHGNIGDLEHVQTQPILEHNYNQPRQPHLNRLSPAETYPDARYQNNSFVSLRSRETHSVPNSLFPRSETVTSGAYQFSGHDLHNQFGRFDNMPENAYRGSLPHTMTSGAYIDPYHAQPGNRHLPVHGRPILGRHHYIAPTANYYEQNQSPDYRVPAHFGHYLPGASHSGMMPRQHFSHVPQHRTPSPSSNVPPRHFRPLYLNANDHSQLINFYPHPVNGQRPCLRAEHPQNNPGGGVTDYRHSRNTPVEPNFGNPRNMNSWERQPNLVTIQPHQQYENNGMSDIHGRLEASSSTSGTPWTSQCDRRFGSLDRRRAITKTSEEASHSRHHEENGFHRPAVHLRRHIDGRALVRTQSLGSVGLNTENNNYQHSDDTESSCDGEIRPRPILKKKEKDWTETSLDCPLNECQPLSRPQSTVPTPLSSEHVCIPMETHEEYLADPPRYSNDLPNNYGYIQSPNPDLEIPAESNPSPRVPEQLNIEHLNNNLPENCMMVQQGIIKPYHEETKPFEMSDFYKYSTKFNKSPQKDSERSANNVSRSSFGEGTSNDSRFAVWGQPSGAPDASSENLINEELRNPTINLFPINDNSQAPIRPQDDINNWLDYQENNNNQPIQRNPPNQRDPSSSDDESPGSPSNATLV